MCIGGGGSSVSPPDPRVSIPLQEGANARAFDRMIGAQRVNQVGPTGSSTWIPPSGFNYNPSIPSVPDAAGGTTPQGYRQAQSPANNFAQAVGAGGTPGAAPGAPPTATLPGTADGANPSGPWTQITQLSPNQATLLGQQERSSINMGAAAEDATRNLGGIYGRPLDVSGLPGGGSFNPGDNTGRVQQVTDALYGKAMRFAEPQFAKDTDNLRQSLISRGFAEGSTAYKDELERMGQQQETFRADARDRAIAGGGMEDSRLFGLDQGTFNTNQSARNQQLAELLTRRALPLNEIAALRSGSPMNIPQLGSGQAATPNFQAPDVMGALNSNYQGQVANANAGAAMDANAFQGLAQLAMMYFMGSDVRLKRNLRYIGKTRGGRNWYHWDWVTGGRGRGIIAQQNPDVSVNIGGTLHVDYSRVS